MTNPLEVTPEHLYATSAGLTTAQAAASTAITSSSATIAPVPAGADDVSVTTSAAFTSYAAIFWQAVGAGLGKHQAGAQALLPVAADYQATDASSSAAIGAHRSLFAAPQAGAQVPVPATADHQPTHASDGEAIGAHRAEFA